MSKRVDAIRTLFAQSPLSADNRPERAPAGPVRSMRENFSEVERENEALRIELEGAQRVVEIDPALVDPSPFADRFSQDFDPAFDALKSSIAERGQEVPILARPHPTAPGRYQAAYGHRRLRAARDLERTVRAIVRPLADEDLVIAQGLENSARQDLCFIERAMFALMLETSGLERSVIQKALAVDKAEASKLIAVARDMPPDLVNAIGRAAKVGRPRWMELAQAVQAPGALKRARKASAEQGFAAAAPEERFLRVLRAAKPERARAPGAFDVRDRSGAPAASVRAAGRDVRVALARADGRRFAAFLAERLPELLQAFEATQSATD